MYLIHRNCIHAPCFSFLFHHNSFHSKFVQAGEPKFIEQALKFVYGEDSVPLLENRVHGIQSLSGTGGLRVFGELMRKHGHKHIYVPNPTWGNHIPIFQNSGLEVRKYRYYDKESSDLDFVNMMKDIKDMPEGSIVLLHACKYCNAYFY